MVNSEELIGTTELVPQNWYHRISEGYAVAQFVEALRYKSEGRGFIPDGVIGMFHWHNPSSRTMALGSSQPLTEMSTVSISWG
jgi:hypothetical protein